MTDFLNPHWTRVVLWITLIALISVVVWELYQKQIEGFINNEDSLAPVRSNFWARLVPRRGDVGPELEIVGINRDKRYFSGYADVQRFGAKTDFCRVVNQSNDPLDLFFACALGGTDNTSSISYKSQTVRKGLKLSRDDYMNDSNGDGREDYCRILKGDTGFEPLCNAAGDNGFDDEMLIDSNPPEDIKVLLSFYEGAMFWLRFYDDTFDYAQNLILRPGGGVKVDDTEPNPLMTNGLTFNGVNQYLRIGDDRKLAIGGKVLPRSMRAISFWVKFNEFTNNAHIFDFGNGAGIDNVWCGIQGRGNLTLGSKEGDLLTKLCKGIGTGTETLPSAPSGQQPGLEVSPQTLMKTTCANVNDYECNEMSVSAKPPPRADANKEGEILYETADMIYEIWEEKVRKMRIKVPGAFKKGEWTHVVITSGNADSFRPDILIYINGSMKFIQPSGWLPTAGTMKNNFIGRSNWADTTSQYANKDELLNGAVFDMRSYSIPMNDKIIKETVKWGRKRLGIENPLDPFPVPMNKNKLEETIKWCNKRLGTNIPITQTVKE